MAAQYEGLLDVFPMGGEGLREFFSRLKWSDEDLRDFLGTMRKTGEFEKLFETDQVAGLLAAGDFFQVDGGKRNGGNKEVSSSKVRKAVRFRVREGGKQYIRSVLGDYFDLVFDFNRGVYHPHPVLRVFKDLMDSYVWGLIPSSAVVVEVGPNPTAAIRRGVVKGKYYGLLPRLTAADLERRSTAVGYTRKAVAVGSYTNVQALAAKDYLMGDCSEMFLPLALQNVTIAADVLVALDSAYDVPLSSFVSAMDRCGAVDGYISMVTVPHPSLGVVSGRVGGTEMVYETDGGNYDFFFEGSSTRAYTHKKDVVDEYFRHDVREIICGGVRYICAKRPVSNEVVTLWHVYRAPSGVVGDASRPTYVKVGGPGRVVLETTAVDMRYPKGSPKRFSPVRYDLGVETFSRALGARLQDPAGDATRVYNHLRVNRSNVVYAGVLRSVDEQLPYNTLSGLAVAIDAFARQLDVTADEEMLAVRSTLVKGGWFVSDSVVTEALKGIKDKVVAAVVSNYEVPLVTVDVVKDVLVVPNEPMVIGVGAGITFCRRAAVAADVASRYGKAAVSAVGMNEWYTASLRTCGCASCELRKEEEESDKFFDCESSRSDDDLDDVFSVFGVGSGTEESSVDVPIGVADSVVRSVAADYVNVLEEQMNSKEAMARDSADKFSVSGGFTLRKLALNSTETLQHYWVEVGATGEILNVKGGGKIDSLGLVYDPRRGIFMRPRVISGAYVVDSEAYGDCYSNSALEVWNGPEIVATVRDVLADPGFGKGGVSPFKLLNGIWGSGKSFLAKAWFRKVKEEGWKPLYLCASKDPMLEVRKELYGDKEEGKSRVKTVDSAMVNARRRVEVTHMVIDEAVMIHPAVVFVLWWLYKPRVVWLAGDVMQNEFCTFVANLRADYPSIVPFCEVALLQEGHRCPFDVYAAGLEVYGTESGIRPCACHERPVESLRIERIQSVQQVDVTSRALTHFQRTKNEIRKVFVASGKSVEQAADLVTTGVEFQGGTAGAVQIVRDVRPEKKGGLYHELRRANVLISRSTGDTVYRTVSVEKDQVVKLVEASRSEHNRDIIRQNIRNGGDKFGLVQLVEFLEGNLSSEHHALVAGAKLKEKFLVSF